jgi:hypothetical protein
MTQLRLGIGCTALGLLLSLLLLARETPYTLTAFMFLAQPLILVGMVLFVSWVISDLRRRGLI